MSFRREISDESSRGFTNLTRREEIILRNRDRARRRRRTRDGLERESAETAERTIRIDSEDLRFDPNRSLHGRAIAAERRRSEQIIRRPERRHTDNAQFREPVVSHRIVGRDVDVKEERMYKLLPAPDPELHVRTWRSLKRAYPKANIVEMVTGLDREEFMEFARIIITSLPATSIVDMRRRGMMEDIQRVTGLGIVDYSHQSYNDGSYGQTDLEDELIYDLDSDDIEVPSKTRRHSYSNISQAAEISSDEPMDDCISNNEYNNLRDQSMPQSVKDPPPNSLFKPSHVRRGHLESLRQNDEDEEGLLSEDRANLPSITVVPLTRPSKTNSRPPNSILTGKTGKFREAEIRRFRECIAAAHHSQIGQKSRAKIYLDK